jgi:hypothetical protein
MGVVVAPSVTLAQILPGGKILSQESEFLQGKVFFIQGSL